MTTQFSENEIFSVTKETSPKMKHKTFFFVWGGRVSPQFMLTGYTRFLKNSLKCGGGGGGVQSIFSIFFFFFGGGGRKIVIRRQTHNFLINEIYCVPNSPFSFLL
jgi:hypothetical protein